MYLRFLLRMLDDEAEAEEEEEEEPPPMLAPSWELRMGTVPRGASFSPLICSGFTRSKLPSLVCKWQEARGEREREIEIKIHHGIEFKIQG